MKKRSTNSSSRSSCNKKKGHATASSDAGLLNSLRPLSVCMVISLALILLSACGGGGGGGSNPLPFNLNPVPANDQTNPMTPADGSNFISGNFLDSSVYKDSCGDPRTNSGGEFFPDLLGSFEDEGFWLRSWSNETYLWYDEIVDVDPALYATSATGVVDYFSLLVTPERTPSGNPKDRFHFTADTAEYEAQSREGSSSGYGALFRIISGDIPRELVVALVNADSPAAAAGLERGTRIIGVDGADLVYGIDTDTLNAGLFPGRVGEPHIFELLDPGAEESRTITMTSAEITIDPVPMDIILATDTGNVGYLLFTDHIMPAEQKLVDAIDRMGAANITDLVLDLRYNSGGFLYLASQLAYMIAGPSVSGRTFGTLEFNDKNPGFNPITGEPIGPSRFETQTYAAEPRGALLPTLNLPSQRVFVLTTRATCSASEAIINGLSGVGIEVIQMGTSTCGKPYGFYPQDNCGTTYFTTQFRAVNAAGFGDYPDGFSPSDSSDAAVGASLPGCPVTEDFSPLGVAQEPLLAKALAYRDDPDTCSVQMISANPTVAGPNALTSSTADANPTASSGVPARLVLSRSGSSAMWLQRPEL